MEKNSESPGPPVYAGHCPVLYEAILGYVDYPADAVVVDATLGLAGHSLGLAKRLGPDGLLVGLDVDSVSLGLARERLSRLKGLKCRVELVQENFGRLDDVLAGLDVEQTDFILADLGISSRQLADAEVGISFQQDGPLDMRLDMRLEQTAADLVNTLGQEDLANVIYQYGEERKSRRIARTLVEMRRNKRFETTGELCEAVLKAFNMRSAEGRRGKIHPATRTFQALRIAVNDELGQLERLLRLGPRILRSGGMMAIISFHSLEDRLVKWSFRGGKADNLYEILTPRPVVADEDERLGNPRSRSAKLRVVRRTDGSLPVPGNNTRIMDNRNSRGQEGSWL